MRREKRERSWWWWSVKLLQSCSTIRLSQTSARRVGSSERSRPGIWLGQDPARDQDGAERGSVSIYAYLSLATAINNAPALTDDSHQPPSIGVLFSPPPEYSQVRTQGPQGPRSVKCSRLPCRIGSLARFTEYGVRRMLFSCQCHCKLPACAAWLHVG